MPKMKKNNSFQVFLQKKCITISTWWMVLDETNTLPQSKLHSFWNDHDDDAEYKVKSTTTICQFHLFISNVRLSASSPLYEAVQYVGFLILHHLPLLDTAAAACFCFSVFVNQNRNCIWALTFLIEREYLFTLTAICAFHGQNKHQARRTIPCFSCNKMKDKKKTKTLKRTWRGHFRLQHLCKQKSRRGNLQQNQDLLKTDHHILNWTRQNYSSGLRLD